MSRLAILLAAVGSLALPAVAQAQVVNIPVVRVPATVTGAWVLNPRACPDIREDVRDARITTSRQDLREDRRDQRVINCPPSAYSFVPDAGQAPTRRIRIDRYGNARFIDRNYGGGYGGGGYRAPTTNYYNVTPVPPVRPQYNAPTPYGTTTYGTTTYTSPSVTGTTVYGTGTTTYGGTGYSAPSVTGTTTYGGTTYSTPQTYVPSAPTSNYIVRDGQIIFSNNP